MSISKKVAIVHYRVGRTDGVSLEIAKRKQILESLGHSVRLISGPIQKDADFVIEDLEFDHPDICRIKENSFGFFNERTVSQDSLLQRIDDLARKIEKKFLAYHQQEKFDLLLIHNIYSHGRHIAAASAFTRIADRVQIPVISTNHDYYWERPEYINPANEGIRNYLDTYVPPNHKCIRHVSINSLAQAELFARRGIQSEVFPDIFDFQQRPWERDDYNSDFLTTNHVGAHDLVVLQATRIVERKAIEIAIEFVQGLQRNKQQLVGATLYNGKKLTEDSEVVFVVAGYAEDSARDYLEKLRDEVKRLGIRANFIAERIGASRSSTSCKKYSLWDAYVFADLVTYPSLVEGWGNQFIEAVFAKKLIALFEYPVFKQDIEKEGYSYISFGDTVTRSPNNLVRIPVERMNRAVSETMTLLKSNETNHLTQKNFEIGQQYHDYAVLETYLSSHLV